MQHSGRILGIDPGSRKTGVGIIDRHGNSLRHIHHQTIHCSDGDFPSRLATLFHTLKAIILEYQPDVVAIEDLFIAKNANSALKLGQARGALIAACADSHCEIVSYTPTLIKKALSGFGRADKRQMQYMVSMLLAIKEPLQEDAADALAVAICHAHHCPMQSQHKKQHSR
ncbi:MAG: crossover junction endodeoxyribonuclease RuvC [Mariprofundales bacterium]|nr:crossover junction endodeoxyribonuclease RuvC [Mariprofundales bacterium]